MKTKSKPVGNEEFTALMQEMKAAGFRPADVARMLNKSPGAISQYLSGYTKPSKTVLELLRRVLKEKKSNSFSTEHLELIEKLNVIKLALPDRYKEGMALIEAIYQTALAVGERQEFSKKAAVIAEMNQKIIEGLLEEDIMKPAIETFKAEGPRKIPISAGRKNTTEQKQNFTEASTDRIESEKSKDPQQK